MDDATGTARPTRRWGRSAALVGAGLVAGGIVAGTLTAGAQTNGSTAADTAATGTAGRPAHGPGETLLTGTTAQKVRAAALAAVPGGTVIRVETDSAGSPYEAHVRKADGSEVTVKVDRSFTVTSTEAFGGHTGDAPPASA